jgi:hypothetical protein
MFINNMITKLTTESRIRTNLYSGREINHKLNFIKSVIISPCSYEDIKRIVKSDNIYVLNDKEKLRLVIFFLRTKFVK